MAQIIFYEKPGCLNNGKQKKQLRQAGHTIVAKDLLTENWVNKVDELRAFFGDKPVSEWFNKNAPLIKQGAIDPSKINAEQAISLMLAHPLLIRRPLIEIGEQRFSGFDTPVINRLLGNEQPVGDLESCLQQQHDVRRHG